MFSEKRIVKCDFCGRECSSDFVSAKIPVLAMMAQPITDNGTFFFLFHICFQCWDVRAYSVRDDEKNSKYFPKSIHEVLHCHL